MKKKILALLLCLTLLGGLFGCGAAPTEKQETEKPAETTAAAAETKAETKAETEAATEGEFAGTTVTFMITQANYYDSYQTIMDKILEDEGITVDIQVLPDDQYFEAIRVKLSTGEVPDIFMNTIPGRYVDVNAAETCIALDDQPWVSRMVNADLVRASDGKIYGFPMSTVGGIMGMCYNKELLAAAGYEDPQPKTWAEFLKLLDDVKAANPDVTTLYMSDADTWTTQVWMTAGLSVLLGDKGTETYDKLTKNELKFADVPEFSQLLTDFKSLYDGGYTNMDNFSATYDMGNEAVATGKAAMYFIPNFGAQVMATLGDPNNIGIFTVPFGDQDTMAVSTSLTGFMIPKDAKNQAAALKVLDLMSQPEYLDLYFEEHPGNPAFTDVATGDVLPCILKIFDEYVNTGKCYPEMNAGLGTFSAVQTEWWNYYTELIAGTKSAAEVVEAIDLKNADYMHSAGEAGW